MTKALALPNKAHLLPHEIQTFLRLSRRTIYRFLQRGIIPSKQFGHEYRIPRDEFITWYESQRRNSEEE